MCPRRSCSRLRAGPLREDLKLTDGSGPATALGTVNSSGGVTGGRFSRPEYHRSAPSVKSANNYLPGLEELGDDEIRRPRT